LQIQVVPAKFINLLIFFRHNSQLLFLVVIKMSEDNFTMFCYPNVATKFWFRTAPRNLLNFVPNRFRRIFWHSLPNLTELLKSIPQIWVLYLWVYFEWCPTVSALCVGTLSDINQWIINVWVLYVWLLCVMSTCEYFMCD